MSKKKTSDKEKLDKAVEKWVAQDTNEDLGAFLNLCERVRSLPSYSKLVPLKKEKDGKLVETEQKTRIPNDDGEKVIDRIFSKVYIHNPEWELMILAKDGRLSKFHFPVLEKLDLSKELLQKAYNTQTNKWKKRWNGAEWKWEAQNPTNGDWEEYAKKVSTPTDTTTFIKHFGKATSLTDLAKQWGLTSEKEVKEVVDIFEGKLGRSLPSKPTYTDEEEQEMRKAKILGLEEVDEKKADELLKSLGISNIFGVAK